MGNGDCTIGAEVRVEIKGLKERTDDLHEVDEQQWDALTKLRDRLPVWATLAFAALCTIIGVLATLAVV